VACALNDASSEKPCKKIKKACEIRFDMPVIVNVLAEAFVLQHHEIGQ
jgi:hypothetical protein